MTRTDALIAAATAVLEQYRAILDAPGPIKSVQIDLKITPTNTVRCAMLSPAWESRLHPMPAIDRYEFLDDAK